MIKIFSKKKINEYWHKLYDSHKCKMSRGAQNLAKIISWPRGDNWRRKNPKK